MEQIESAEVIGKGTCGVIYKTKDKETGSYIAIKAVQLSHSDMMGISSSTMREIALMKELKHENIIMLKDVVHVWKKSKLYLVFEFIDMDLGQLLEKNKDAPLLLALVKSYTRQMLEGLQYCHSRRVFHRNLKPQNLLIDTEGRLKLTDFGLAGNSNFPLKLYTHDVVTLWYKAPEILLDSRSYSCAVDLWSVGCIVAEMLQGKALFPGTSEIDQLFRIFRIFGTPNEITWPGVTALCNFQSSFPSWESRDIKAVLPTLPDEAVKLFLGLMTYYPKERFTAQQVLKDPWLQDKCLVPPNIN